MIQEILEQFNDIMVETEFLNVTKIRDLVHYKCKVQLIDGSNLRISEKWLEQQLLQYSSLHLFRRKVFCVSLLQTSQKKRVSNSAPISWRN